MNRPVVIIAFIVLLGWLFGMGYCHNATCPDCQTAKAIIAPPVEESGLSINITDEDLSFSAVTSDNLLFANGSCEYVLPLSDKLETVFKNTVQHLKDNSHRILVLTGLYEGIETNQCSDITDLGIARAEQVKAMLVQMGAPTEQIELEGSEIRDMDEYKNMMVAGVDYIFKEAKEVNPVLEEKALRAGNITLYFETNKQEIILTDEQRDYLNRLKTYLAQNPDAKASVTGHTDDKGDDRWNMRLSRKRSEFVRDFMIEQGISKYQIRNEGIGPDKPIASNATSKGRAQNRRVEITLQ